MAAPEKPDETSKVKDVSYPKIVTLVGLSVVAGVLIASLGGWCMSVIVAFLIGLLVGSAGWLMWRRHEL